MQLTGIHHLTAITADTHTNHAFYTDTLGLRLVKKTVNQDDVSAYHLFYADGKATPGSDITFFDWPLDRERRGTHGIVRTAFRVGSTEALNYFADRFRERKVTQSAITDRDGRATLDFEDPEGQRLSLVVDSSQTPANPWDKSPVPAQHQIRGLGPITISVPDVGSTDALLTRLLNMRRVRQYSNASSDGRSETPVTVAVYEMGAGGPAAELHVAAEPHLKPTRQGAGGVHHVAFRTPDNEQYRGWIDRLNKLRIPSSGPVDRYYFRSLYFQEPNGILFEIATDGPGFDADEPMEHLGERLSLPPFLEGQRQEIEANLHPI